MKWNANVNPGTLKHETKYRLYGQLFGESKVAQDIPYPGQRLEQLSNTLPKGADPQYLAVNARSYNFELSDNGQAQHMNREFFTAHNFPIIFMFFVENGPKTLITVDELGHIYVWSYV